MRFGSVNLVEIIRKFCRRLFNRTDVQDSPERLQTQNGSLSDNPRPEAPGAMINQGIPASGQLISTITNEDILNHQELRNAEQYPEAKTEGNTEDPAPLIRMPEPDHETEHTVVIDATVSHTCMETGLTEEAHCRVCGQVLKAQEVVPALGHTVVIDEVISPTCTETGLTEGAHCSVCGQVLKAQEVIPA